MDKQLNNLISIYFITGVIVLFIVLFRHQYNKDFLTNLKKIDIINCDLWCVGHFIMYVLLGYLSPKYWMVSFILSMVWELSEKYMEKHDIQIKSNINYDITVNTLGLLFGIYLNKYNIIKI